MNKREEERLRKQQEKIAKRVGKTGDNADL